MSQQNFSDTATSSGLFATAELLVYFMSDIAYTSNRIFTIFGQPFAHVVAISVASDVYQKCHSKNPKTGRQMEREKFVRIKKQTARKTLTHQSSRHNSTFLWDATYDMTYDILWHMTFLAEWHIKTNKRSKQKTDKPACNYDSKQAQRRHQCQVARNTEIYNKI